MFDLASKLETIAYDLERIENLISVFIQDAFEMYSPETDPFRKHESLLDAAVEKLKIQETKVQDTAVALYDISKQQKALENSPQS